MTTTPPAAQPYADHILSGSSPAVERLRLQIARIAPHFRVALLTGEPGVGKQCVARQLHAASPAATGPFSILPAAQFAHHPSPSAAGTIYLTGIQSLAPASQVCLLTAIRSLARDARVVVSCRSDLKAMVSAGRLRPDLYEAVSHLEIRIPALRDRLADLDFLASAMLRLRSVQATITPSALERLKAYNWPSNIEELWKLCENLPATTSVVTERDLPPLLCAAPKPSANARLEAVMHRHVADVLQSCAGNKLRAAELLGISRSTLYRMLSTQTQSLTELPRH